MHGSDGIGIFDVVNHSPSPRDFNRSSRSPMMPNPPVTIADRIAAVGGAATMALIVFAIGFAISTRA